MREALAEELKRVPVLAGVIAGLEKLSEEEAAKESAARIDRLLEMAEFQREGVARLLNDIDVLSALATAIFVRQNEMRAWSESSGRVIQPAELTEFALEGTLLAYRSRVAIEFYYADHRGIAGSRRELYAVSLPLDDVYVIPRLLPDQVSMELNSRRWKILRQLDDPDLSEERRADLQQEYVELAQGKWQPEDQPASSMLLGPALARNRSMVLLGEPGTGKSTLARFLARICALGPEAMQSRIGWAEDLVPVVIRLAAFADAKLSSPGLDLHTFLMHQMYERGGEVLSRAVDQELRSGHLFVLLDGLDEIPSQRLHALVVSAVDEFLSFMINQGSNRCLITSRPSGYAPLAGGLPHFRLSNFSTDQVWEFLHRWQRAFESYRHPDIPDLAAADQEAEAVFTELIRSEKVLQLASNPLMLVIVMFIRYEQLQLPDQRVELLNRAVVTLMDTWNAARAQSASASQGGSALPLKHLIRVWGAAAKWMHTVTPTGVVHQAELQRELVRILVEHELDDDDAEATAASYLAAAAEHGGLLEECANGIFAFWHPAFEEYLAAVDLATPAGNAARAVLQVCDDPRWREVVLLAVAYVGIIQRDPDTATQMVEAVLSKGPFPVLDPFLHTRLRLAAACVADDAGVKRAITQRVIVELAKVIAAQPYGPPNETFARLVRAVPRLRPAPATVQALSLLTTHEEPQVRMEAARLLSNVATRDEAARARCQDMMGDKDSDVRCHAALGLARAGDFSPRIWQALGHFRSVYTGINETVRDFIGTLPEEAVEKLTAAVRSTEADPIPTRQGLVALVGLLAPTNKHGANTLRALLGDENASVKLEAAGLLCTLTPTDDRIAPVLVGLLSEDDRYTRLRAAELLLAALRQDQMRAVETLMALSNDDKDWARQSALWALAQLVRVDESVVSVLKQDLTSVDPQTRFNAAALLNQAGCVDEEVAEALTAALEYSDPWIRLTAAHVLESSGLVDECTARVNDELLIDEDSWTRFQASLFRELRNSIRPLDQILEDMARDDECTAQEEVRDIFWRFNEYGLPGIDRLLSCDDARLQGEGIRALKALKFMASVIDYNDPTPRFPVGTTLQERIRITAKRAHIGSRRAMKTLQRVLEDEELSTQDGNALGVMTRINEKDGQSRRVAKTWLAQWLWSKLEPGSCAAPRYWLTEPLVFHAPTDPIADGARAAAKRLIPKYGRKLRSEVEAALVSLEAEQDFDPISLGALIVSIASLAWTVYTDLEEETPSPEPDVVTRTVRAEVRNRDDISPASIDQITHIVVTEVIKAADATDPQGS